MENWSGFEYKKGVVTLHCSLSKPLYPIPMLIGIMHKYHIKATIIEANAWSIVTRSIPNMA